MPLRIAVVTQAYHPAVGGVTEHVAGTARALRARGHQVTVITSGPSRNGARPAVCDGNGSAGGDAAGEHERDVVRMGRNWVVTFNGAENNITLGWGLRARLQALLGDGARPRFDLVHVHCPLSPVLPLMAIDVATIPIVATVHTVSDSDLLLRLFRRPLERFTARLDRVVAVSEAARDYAAPFLPRPAEVVPNGVDLRRFRPGVPRIERFDDDTPNVLFVGRFDPRKGIPDLLRACDALARGGTRFRLILVGDGGLRREAERLASGALRGRVHFEGRVEHDRLPAYYASADVFCSPATGGESFGMVLLEAMALGVPVVATDLPGHRSLVAHGREGLLVPRRDPGSLAGAIGRLLAAPEERRRMGARGLARAAAYDWDAVAARLEAIYGTLVGGRGRTDDGSARDASTLEPAGV
jgi:phosphatidylinositol alpha-mannosyltransferase